MDVGKGGTDCLEGRGQDAGACLPQRQAMGHLWTVLKSVAWFSSFHRGRHQSFLRWRGHVGQSQKAGVFTLHPLKMSVFYLPSAESRGLSVPSPLPHRVLSHVSSKVFQTHHLLLSSPTVIIPQVQVAFVPQGHTMMSPLPSLSCSLGLTVHGSLRQSRSSHGFPSRASRERSVCPSPLSLSFLCFFPISFLLFSVP